MFAALCILPMAGIGSVTALLLRALLTRVSATHSQVQAALLGGRVCATISLVFLALFTGSLDVIWTSGTAEALTFWLVLPLTLYTLAGVLGSCWLQKQCHAGQANVSLALWQSNRS